MGLFCLSRHLRLLFRSQSRSGGVERVRGCAVVMCVCVGVCCVQCGCTVHSVLDVINDHATRLPGPVVTIIISMEDKVSGPNLYTQYRLTFGTKLFFLQPILHRIQNMYLHCLSIYRV